MTCLTAVIGDPVHHSLSPAIVNAAFEELGVDWKMLSLEVPAGKESAVLDLMRELKMGGISVTMPHKKMVANNLAAQEMAELDQTAITLGAVNCVTQRDDKLFGHNTDGAGFLFSLEREGVKVSDSSVLIFGAGGASWAIANACLLAGARRIGICTRNESKAELIVSSFGEACEVVSNPVHSEFEILINATPLGMDNPNNKNLIDETPVGKADISKNHIVIDIVYKPRETKFMSLAQDNGAKVIGGIGMLVGQAFEAVKIWTGEEPNPEKMFQATQ